MMNPRDIEKAARAISKARANLILNSPFFATLALRLDPQPDPRAETIATDGRHLYYDPAWINAQAPADLPGVIAHEAMHVALGHAWRRQNREHQRFNLACDHAINPLLKESGFTLPKGGCSVVNAEYPGLSSEQIYPLIPEQTGGFNGMPDFGGTGCVLDAAGEDGKPLTEAERNQLEAEWKIATLQAAQAAKAQGKLPAGLAALADSIRAPQVDWRAVLREFVRSVAAGDYSWARPNVRHLASGNYFPSLYSETVPPIAVGVDTSGSVSQAELDAVCAELNGILDTVKPEQVTVVYADARVQAHEVFTPDNWPVRMAVKGRGGTDLRGIWPFLSEQEITPCMAICCTDMELTVADLGDDPGYPVLFVSTGKPGPVDGPVAYGTVVQLQS